MIDWTRLWVPTDIRREHGIPVNPVSYDGPQFAIPLCPLGLATAGGYPLRPKSKKVSGMKPE